MTHLIGAHLSIAGGYYKALESAHEKGANCLQIFSSSPRTWQTANPSNEEIQKFLELNQKLNIDPIYFHACYLCNLADIEITGTKSVNVLKTELQLAKRMNIKGSIVHTGSLKRKDIDYKNADEYVDVVLNIEEILKDTPPETLLILENAGNRKIGKDLTELATLLDAVNDKRVRVCLDTCHLHAAGYAMTTDKEFDDFLLAFDTLIGLEKLEVIHMNDSKDSFGALRDRHENLGEGNVDIEVFKNFLHHPKTKHLPFIIETPGFDDKGPDKKNIDILKSWI